MEIKEITNKEVWENFLLQCTEKTFLQSWNWGEFQLKQAASAKALASQSKIWRLGILSNEKLVAVSLVIKFSAKRGTFLFVPHGPVEIEGLTPKDKKEIFELILLQLSDTAKQENVSFIRISPLFERNGQNENIFMDLGFRAAPMHSSAYEATWKLDIFPAQEDLVHNMRKTTRSPLH